MHATPECRALSSGLVALAAFYFFGSAVLRPPDFLAKLSMPTAASLSSAFSSGGGGSGGGGGGGGPGRRPTIRGVGDLPARPRG